MMILASVYDSQVGIWSFPQQFINKGDLTRAWHTACNDPQSPYHKYPAHFTMFVIGEWDDRKGKIVMYQAPESIGLAAEFVTENKTIRMEETANAQ